MENLLKHFCKRDEAYYETDSEEIKELNEDMIEEIEKLNKDMIEKITIPQKYKKRFIKTKSFELPPRRMVYLYGCNGIGKSSLLELINNYYNNKNFKDENKMVIETYLEEPIKCLYWKAENDSAGRGKDSDTLLKNIDMFTDFYAATRTSEGEALTNNFINFLERLDTSKINLLLIDELDSGLGIGSINILKGYLFNFLKKNQHISIIMGINNYQWIYKEPLKNIYRMDKGKEVTINSYDEFVELTLDINQKLLSKKQ